MVLPQSLEKFLHVAIRLSDLSHEEIARLGILSREQHASFYFTVEDIVFRRSRRISARYVVSAAEQLRITRDKRRRKHFSRFAEGQGIHKCLECAQAIVAGIHRPKLRAELSVPDDHPVFGN